MLNGQTVILEGHPISSDAILDSMNLGVYVCDRDRKIVYWSKKAEAITGWQAEDVLGRTCHDDILDHVDKDGRPLCGEDSCPLYRAIVTGEAAHMPVIVFAKGKDGNRIPIAVNVAPLYNNVGKVIGGVETFRDLSGVMPDLKRARQIQRGLLTASLPQDPRLRFSTFYRARDIVGGDFYAISAETDDCYAFILADVEGHGLSAALNSVHLNTVWNMYRDLRSSPAHFLVAANDYLAEVFSPVNAFAVAVCGVFDAPSGELRIAGAGGPPPLVLRPGSPPQWLQSRGIPLGIAVGHAYHETKTVLEPGDRLMMCTDGVFEVHNALREELGQEGFLSILERLDYPRKQLEMDQLEAELLKYSNNIRLQDDLTMTLLEYGA